MQLADFYDYKNRLMEDILTTPSIVSLITDDPAFRTDPRLLTYSQVFPFEYIPETVEHSKTFVCFDVDVQKSLNKTFLSPTLYIWEFTHKSNLRLPNGDGVRTDRLAEEIAKAINGSRCYGLGELDLYSVKRFAPLADYNGKQMTFYLTEFNRPSPTRKSIPAQRKGSV